MPKIFSDKDRDSIRKTLIQLGLDTVEQKGYRSTSVEEIARNAGIAKGTFYNFFLSKEHFYFEAMLFIRDTRRQKLLEFFSVPEKINKESTAEFLVNYLQEKNIHHYFTNEELALIFRKIPEQKVQSNKDSIAFAATLLKKLRIINPHINNEVVVNMLNITADFAADKSHLSIGSKDETIQLMSHALAEYIFKEGK